MFYYLLYNSTIIEKELDEYNRSIKVLIYGTIAYITIHAVLFLGGDESLLSSFKIYFWLFFMLDLIVLFLMFNNKEKKNIFEILFDKKKIESILFKNTSSNTNTNSSRISLEDNKLKKRKVHFDIPQNQNQNHNQTNIESDTSDSDFGSDIDLSSFKKSLLE